MDARGERRCDVNGLLRTDREIFELFWGPEEAERNLWVVPLNRPAKGSPYFPWQTLKPKGVGYRVPSYIVADAETRDGQYVFIAPTLHCGYCRIPEHKDLEVGDLNVGRARFPLWDLVFGYLDHYLKGEQNGFLEKTPRVQYYTMGKNEWASADEWPPAAAVPITFYLGSGGSANSVFGGRPPFS